MIPNSLTSYQVPCTTPQPCQSYDDEDFDDDTICRPYIYNPNADDIFNADFEIESSFKSRLQESATPISITSNGDSSSVAMDGTQTQLFQCPRILGEGAFGKITKARYIHGENVAITTIKKPQAPKKRASAVAVENMQVQIPHVPEGARPVVPNHDGHSHSPCDHTFTREAAIHSSLEVHQNIVTLFGCIETPHCVHLLLECVEGGDLEQELQIKYRLNPRIVAVIAHQLFAALAHVHRAGVAHLDVKPSNILLLKRGDDLEQFAMKAGTSSSESVLKLCDFGQSRVIEHRVHAHASLNSARRNSNINSNNTTPSVSDRSLDIRGKDADNSLLLMKALEKCASSSCSGGSLPPRARPHSDNSNNGISKRIEHLAFLEVDQSEPFGTEGYLPPELLTAQERADGKVVKSISTATDMWAAGACLYRCCTGQIPFRPSKLCLTQDVSAKMASDNIMSTIGCPRLCPYVETNHGAACDSYLTVSPVTPGRADSVTSNKSADAFAYLSVGSSYSVPSIASAVATVCPTEHSECAGSARALSMRAMDVSRRCLETTSESEPSRISGNGSGSGSGDGTNSPLAMSTLDDHPDDVRQQVETVHKTEAESSMMAVDEQPTEKLICSVCHTSDCGFTRRLATVIEKCVVVDARKRTTAGGAFTYLNGYLLGQ
jgi:serine/threonine protein kinase